VANQPVFFMMNSTNRQFGAAFQNNRQETHYIYPEKHYTVPSLYSGKIGGASTIGKKNYSFSCHCVRLALSLHRRPSK